MSYNATSMTTVSQEVIPLFCFKKTIFLYAQACEILFQTLSNLSLF